MESIKVFCLTSIVALYSAPKLILMTFLGYKWMIKFPYGWEWAIVFPCSWERVIIFLYGCNWAISIIKRRV